MFTFLVKLLDDFNVLLGRLSKTVGESNERRAKDRAFLDNLKARGVVLKISNVERKNSDLYIYDENYGQIWSCRNGDLSSSETLLATLATMKGEYTGPMFTGFVWDEDTVTLRFKWAGHHGSSDRYFEKKFNAYKETISWYEV